MISLVSIRSNPRHAGDIERYHQYPTVQRQTNAAHSWHVARIWLACFCSTPAQEMHNGKILVYILRHDVGELETGDVPFPVKAENLILKEEMDRLEAVSLLKQRLTIPELTLWEKASVKVADLIEMAEFGREETRRGCTYGESIVCETLAAVRHYLAGDTFCDEDKRRIRTYVETQIGERL